MDLRSKRKRTQMNKGRVLALDIISDLPLNILEHILVHLPIRDAVRTSVLSRKWRYKWVTIPHLIFDDQCIPICSNDQALVKRNKLVDLVNRVLLLHRGPIHRFELSVSYLQDCSDIDQWILFLSRSDIKEFILKPEEGSYYKVPSSLFSCQQLSHLKLAHCILKPSLTVNGFGCLKSLFLQHVTCPNDVLECPFACCPLLEQLSLQYMDGLTFFKIHAPSLKCLYLEGTLEGRHLEHTYSNEAYANEALGSLIASCPLLERLSLVDVDGLTSLKIHAPKLKYLYLNDDIDFLSIENCPLLANMSIALHATEYAYENRDQIACDLIKVLNCLPGLETLVAEEVFLQHFGVGDIAEKLSTTYNHLKCLELRGVSFEDMYQISFILCLISRSPTLQRLEISGYPCIQAALEAHELDFWETQHSSNCTLNQLQSVKIIQIFGMPNELQFIKFMLAKSPALQMMEITCDSRVNEGGRLDILTNLEQFRQASTQTEIICYYG